MKRLETWIVAVALGSLRFAACAGETRDTTSRTNATVCTDDSDCASSERCVAKRCVATDAGSGLFGTGGGVSTGGRQGAGGRGPSLGGSGNESNAGASSGSGGSRDASVPWDGGCRSGEYPLNTKLGPETLSDSGVLRCFAELPPGVDLAHASIEAGLTTVSTGASYVKMRRSDAPCDNGAGFRKVDENTIEICSLCQTSFGLSFRAVVDCASAPPSDASVDVFDGCVRRVVTARMRRDDRGCTVELPPNADRAVPIRSSLPFGILGGGGLIHLAVGYEPTPSCDDPQNYGWQPIGNGPTIRLCQGICSSPVFDGQAFDVSLTCGADAAD